MTGPLADVLIGLCDDILRGPLADPTRERVMQVRRRLESPLRVVVAGAVSSGKSTLVNALLRQRVAPVGAGETTRVVTWYRFGPADRVEIEFVDGHRESRMLASGRLPSDLGCRAEDVARVVVELSNDALRNVQLIDTPGLNTTSTGLEAATRAVMGMGEDSEDRASRAAIDVADAVVFLMPHLRAADAELLQALMRLYGGTRMSGLTTIGVLSKIDRLTTDDDPWGAAQRVAGRMSDVLRPVVSAVTPVVGLLAETARCGSFTERDATALRAIAALDADTRTVVLCDATLFLTAPEIPLDEPMRRRLFDQLGLYGLTVALDAINRGAVGATDLVSGLDETSGMADLVDCLERRVLSRADLLAAHAALANLRRLSYGSRSGAEAAVLAGLRDSLDRLEMDPAMQRLQLLDQLTDINQGRLDLEPERREELERLAISDDPTVRLGLPAGAGPDGVRQGAIAMASAWTVLANDPRRSPAERTAARHMRTALELILASASAPTDITAVAR